MSFYKRKGKAYQRTENYPMGSSKLLTGITNKNQNYGGFKDEPRAEKKTGKRKWNQC